MAALPHFKLCPPFTYRSRSIMPFIAWLDHNAQVNLLASHVHSTSSFQVAAAAAYYQNGQVAAETVARLVSGAVCVIAWLNLSNDGFDASTGVDTTKPESMVNLTGSRTLVLALSAAFFFAGGTQLWSVVIQAADGSVAAMLAAAIACGYVYQGPPFR